MKSKREAQILLLEDDEVDIESIQRALSKLNRPIRLHTARNGIEALDMLFGHNGTKQIPTPQLIILDIKMPLMNGIEFLTKLRGNSVLGGLNVIILTTSDAEKDKLDALNLNIAGYFLKPLNHDEFLGLCKILLD